MRRWLDPLLSRPLRLFRMQGIPNKNKCLEIKIRTVWIFWEMILIHSKSIHSWWGIILRMSKKMEMPKIWENPHRPGEWKSANPPGEAWVLLWAKKSWILCESNIRASRQADLKSKNIKAKIRWKMVKINQPKSWS